MRNRRIAPHAALLLALFLALPHPGGAGESIGEVEKDLSAAIQEMKAIGSELDRLEELASFPRATGIRVEVLRDGQVPAPVKGRLLLEGKVEEEREWPSADREAFSGNISIPLAFQLPFLPGSYPARVELFHPSWKTPPSADFRVVVRKGEVAPVRLRLTLSPGKAVPSLAAAGEPGR